MPNEQTPRTPNNGQVYMRLISGDGENYMEFSQPIIIQGLSRRAVETIRITDTQVVAVEQNLGYAQRADEQGLQITDRDKSKLAEILNPQPPSPTSQTQRTE